MALTRRTLFDCSLNSSTFLTSVLLIGIGSSNGSARGYRRTGRRVFGLSSTRSDCHRVIDRECQLTKAPRLRKLSDVSGPRGRFTRCRTERVGQ
jgi:hypothetical protein